MAISLSDEQWGEVLECIRAIPRIEGRLDGIKENCARDFEEHKQFARDGRMLEGLNVKIGIFSGLAAAVGGTLGALIALAGGR